MKTFGVIPARGGSKEIPRKNIKLLNGKPLIAYTIEAAQRSKLDGLVVSTEDDEIAEIAKGYGAEVLPRPAHLATDEVNTEVVIQHIAKELNPKPKILVTLQPTSPLRTHIHINEAIKRFIQGKFDSLLSVYQFHGFLWVQGMQCPFPLNYDPLGRRPRRQDALVDYKENGAIYIAKTKLLATTNCGLPGRVGLYTMAEEDSLEIDTEFDFWLCEERLKYEIANRR